MSRTDMENEIENTIIGNSEKYFLSCVTIFAEIEDMDEFVDAIDLYEDEDDVYDNIQFVVDGNNDDFDDDMDDHLHELGLMLNSTLASDYDGATAARLNAHFFNDWRILLEKKALELGFPDLEELLKSEYMKDYVEQTSSVDGVAIYGAVSRPENEHILRRVADCKLNEEQKAEKRRKQRLVALKNPENRQNFLEGKRRILEILLDLKAYKTEVDYQTIRDEYLKLHNVSLNASEHQRLFMNKSAFKNFCRVFYREVIIINHNPIRIKLRSPDIKIPEKITEEDLRLLANINKIELPIFPLEYSPLASNIVRKERTPEYLENVAAPDGDILKKPVDLNEDKYTGDEESADSSDSEVEVSKKYRKKKFKGNMNTFNISSGTQSLLQIEDIDKTAVRSSHSEKNLNHVEQSVPNSEENKASIF
uniref:Uncharacterized protein n=2 Tax=Onchocerca TaxID=6281 RepID=A0A8R1XUG7_ONCVO